MTSQDRDLSQGRSKSKGKRPTVARRLRLETLESRRVLAAFNYALANPGFESPDLDANNGYSNSVPGWTVTGVPGITYESPFIEASPAPEGDQYLWGDFDNWKISQSGPAIAANTRYLLTLDAFALSTGVNRLTVTLKDSAGFVLEKQAFQPLTNPAQQDFELPVGEWSTIKLVVNSAAFASSIQGRDLVIDIEGSRLAVDNVELLVDDEARDLYVSSSEGVASNDGYSAASSIPDFAELADYLPLLPGDRILLKAGDTFTEELNLRGKGTADQLVELSSYGAGPNPIIRRQDVTDDVGVIWNNASHARISNIDVEHSKLGIYLRYEFRDFGSTNVTIENSNFRDMPDPTLAAEDHNFEYAWSDAIWVGGQAWGAAEFATRLDGLTIRNVTATNTAHLFGTAWYFPQPYYSRVTNLVIEDSVAYNNLAGAFQLFNVDGARISRVHSIGGGGDDTWSGTTLGFVQSSRNIIIEDSVFERLDRAQAADGTGMDFEGDTHNVIFRNNVIHSNAGSGLLILSTGGRNTNLTIENNTFYNNAVDPWNSEINSEVQGSNDNHTGIIRNNAFYRGDPSINFLSPGANWSGFQISGNTQAEYADVAERPSSWEFESDGDFEGWAAFNHWGSVEVSGGALRGVSTDADPYGHSGATWVDTNTTPYAWVRMSQTAGAFGQFFFITETDPVWNAEKSVFFPINPDGQMHDYFIDFGALETTNGVITQVRLDPTIEAGSDMAIDFVRLTDSTDLAQTPPPNPLPLPQQSTFTSIASQDGYVTESGQNTGVGGSVNTGSSTFRIGDDSSNRAYRSFLSFDTSALPDNAIVTQATIGITRVGNPSGSIPIGIPNSQFGDILVDIANPSFGGAGLAAADWQSSATELGVSKFAWPAYSNGMTIYSRLDDPHTPLVNTEGSTQFRIRYANDDDGDNVSDYMPYASGNYFSTASRPSLEIEYYVPSGLPGDFDTNGVVDQSDYNLWRQNYGATAGAGLLADGNADGRVDAADYSIWRDNLGATLPAIAAATAQDDVDEPVPLVGAPTVTVRFATAPEGPPSDGAVTVASNDDLLLLALAVSPSSGAEAAEELSIAKQETETTEVPELDNAFAGLVF